MATDSKDVIDVAGSSHDGDEKSPIGADELRLAQMGE